MHNNGRVFCMDFEKNSVQGADTVGHQSFKICRLWFRRRLPVIVRFGVLCSSFEETLAGATRSIQNGGHSVMVAATNTVAGGARTTIKLGKDVDRTENYGNSRPWDNVEHHQRMVGECELSVASRSEHESRASNVVLKALAAIETRTVTDS